MLSEINQRLAFGLTVASSKIHGRGCFACVTFRPGERIAEYVGERISLVEAERRRQARGEKFICDVDAECAIDGQHGGNGTQYVNHSCDPNAYVVVSDKRIFLHALRKIVPYEEITTDYLYELDLEQIACRCGATTCDQTARRVRAAEGSGKQANQIETIVDRDAIS